MSERMVGLLHRVVSLRRRAAGRDVIGRTRPRNVKGAAGARCSGPRGPIRGGGMDVAGKVALLTGGARIGQTVSQAIAQRGCGLALTYRRSRDAAEATAAAARATGVRTVVLRADVIDEAQIAAAVRQAEQVLGRLDILVNLASTYERTPFESAGARTSRTRSTPTPGAPGCSQSMPRLRCGGPAAAASST
ncbi:MAG: SDR family NAD(P)-dependent oxidoreductase [Deltaproteobacteria bacterium]|nr:MAG: SDR family NAD(P)-dependent oxidoreductase [Deltaproteobacteria bacterium]